jgi:hypothetical protein
MGLISITTTPSPSSPVPINLTILLTDQRLLLSSGSSEKIGKVVEKTVKRKSPKQDGLEDALKVSGD